MSGGRLAGGTKQRYTQLSSASTVKVDSNVKMKKIIQDPPAGKYRCSCCGKEYKSQKGNFPVTNSWLDENNNGYLTVCRSCIEKYYQQLIEFYSGNEEHAIEHCCRLFDWYYNTDAAAMTKNASKGYSRISMYPSKMNMVQIRDKGTTFLDTLRERYSNRIMSEEDIQSAESENSATVSKETIQFFGFGYSDEEYAFLAKQYTDWTTRYECKTKAQEELFKNICISQLTIQRVQKNGAAREVADAMKTFQDLLGTANLKPNQTNDNALADQNTFGTLIKKWENDAPIAEPDEEWKDVDGIHRYINTWFLGHLSNLVHVKNDYEEEYEREKEKYTVVPPTYEEDEDVGETSILDKYSNKGEKR